MLYQPNMNSDGLLSYFNKENENEYKYTKFNNKIKLLKHFKILQQ